MKNLLSSAPSFGKFVSGIVVLSLVVYIGLPIFGIYSASLEGVGATWFGLYSLVVVMSATKLYGKSVYKAVQGAVQKGASTNSIIDTSESRNN